MTQYRSLKPDYTDEWFRRLDVAVSKWVAKFPEDAQRVKESVYGAKYIDSPPEEGSLMAMTLRVAFDQSVLKMNPQWPQKPADLIAK